MAAGTADLPVAREAVLTARHLGRTADLVVDVGVAGLHRLLRRLDLLRAVRVIVVVAGMDGALPAVVAGLVAAPVVAVPTSTGYGAAFEGLAALLTMLNSCAPGVAVVNIDNGYGSATWLLRSRPRPEPMTHRSPCGRLEPVTASLSTCSVSPVFDGACDGEMQGWPNQAPRLDHFGPVRLIRAEVVELWRMIRLPR